MPRLPLDRVEELVEESVFHPSPCKRHRERVLRDAAQATIRQKISHRMIVGFAASALVLGMGVSIVWIATSSGRAVPDAAAPGTAAAVEGRTSRPSTHPAAAGSLGEGLYHANPASGQDPPSKGL